MLGPAPGGRGWRLYAVEAVPVFGPKSPEECPDVTHSGRYRAAARWHVLGLEPATLEVEGVHVLDRPPGALAVAPDGSHAYVLVDRSALLLDLDLIAGESRRLLALPGPSAAPAVTARRLYAPDPFGSEVWVVDRGVGRLVQTIRVGRHPANVALGRPP